MLENQYAYDQGVLLTSEQIAEFVARGYLRFDGIVPNEINQLGIEEMNSSFRRWRLVQTSLTTGAPLISEAEGLTELVASGTPMTEAFSPDSAYGRLLQLPQGHSAGPGAGAVRGPDHRPQALPDP